MLVMAFPFFMTVLFVFMKIMLMMIIISVKMAADDEDDYVSRNVCHTRGVSRNTPVLRTHHIGRNIVPNAFCVPMGL